MHDTEVLFKFLQKRKQHSDQNLSIVNVIQIGGGRDNYCLTNAEDVSRNKGYAVVSGWLSLPQKNQENSWQKQFTQHWWNYDQSQRKHFDFSPNIDDGAVYIQDDGIAKFVIDNGTKLKSHVSSSIIVNNDEFFIIDYAENGFKYQQADDLSNDVIFFFQTV